MLESYSIGHLLPCLKEFAMLDQPSLADDVMHGSQFFIMIRRLSEESGKMLNRMFII